jgi:hypothetical protein
VAVAVPARAAISRAASKNRFHMPHQSLGGRSSGIGCSQGAAVIGARMREAGAHRK